MDLLLSSAEREVLRLRVVAALESGKIEGCRQAAEVFGVSERPVGTGWRAYRRDGRDGPATRRGRPGPAEPRRLLNDDTIATSDRVAGLLVLLYAQRAVRIANRPISLPPTLGELVLQLLADRRSATTPDQETWLYPAKRLGQPLSPRDLLGRLRTLGISPTLGRNMRSWRWQPSCLPP